MSEKKPFFGTAVQKEPFFGKAVKKEPFFGTAVQKEPFFGTAVKKEPFFGTAVNKEPFFGTAVSRPNNEASPKQTEREKKVMEKRIKEIQKENELKLAQIQKLRGDTYPPLVPYKYQHLATHNPKKSGGKIHTHVKTRRGKKKRNSTKKNK